MRAAGCKAVRARARTDAVAVLCAWCQKGVNNRMFTVLEEGFAVCKIGLDESRYLFFSNDVSVLLAPLAFCFMTGAQGASECVCVCLPSSLLSRPGF